MIHRGRMTARPEGDFAVFLIGMRINAWWRVDKWLPVLRAMPRMLTELYRNRELGFLSYEMWVGRTTILVQYWQSTEHLVRYAQARESAHLPAWQAFNKAVGDDGAVGIWHETYVSGPGRYENVYVNMPTFGLGKVGPLVEATGALKSARDRMRQADPGEPAHGHDAGHPHT